MHIIVHNIRALRLQKGWSQQELASRLNISIPALSKIETGITDIKVSRLYQLASVLDLPLTKLGGKPLGEIQLQADRDDCLHQKMLRMDTDIFHLQQVVINLYEALLLNK